jgi:formylglycine-generating enzyme required for sulfatase activity
MENGLPHKTTFTLNMLATNGSVAMNPNQNAYDSGTIVLCLATANNEYRFINWSGDATGVENPVSITMTTNKNITAVFGKSMLPEMILMNGGKFFMGADSSCRTPGGLNSDKNIVHEVFLTSFYIGKYLVTQQQYEAVIGRNPSLFSGNGQRPVENVDWNDAVFYCNALSRQSGMDTVYSYTGKTETPGDRIWILKDISIDYTKNGFRLPTEAEWEYACKAGTETNYYFGNDTGLMKNFVWYWGNSDSSTHPVGLKQPNGLNLYDMLGNVWQWCNDWYAANDGGSQIDPIGPVFGYDRLNRGGCWHDVPTQLRSVNRDRYGSDNPYDKGPEVGFRLARSSR